MVVRRILLDFGRQKIAAYYRVAGRRWKTRRRPSVSTFGNAVIDSCKVTLWVNFDAFGTSAGCPFFSQWRPQATSYNAQKVSISDKVRCGKRTPIQAIHSRGLVAVLEWSGPASLRS
jgi:hypothetical protein